jgi:hypothetical protein
MMDDWYEIVNESGLEQGDILRSLDVPRVTRRPSGAYSAVVTRGDFIVLSQSCDLDNDKIAEVLLAAVFKYDRLYAEADHYRASSFRRSMVMGAQPAFFLLPPHSAVADSGWCLVDFHHLHLLEKAACSQFATSSGPRLRLRPPYKEYLAQSYGRYMMRVALPSPPTGFESYRPA